MGHASHFLRRHQATKHRHYGVRRLAHTTATDLGAATHEPPMLCITDTSVSAAYVLVMSVLILSSFSGAARIGTNDGQFGFIVCPSALSDMQRLAVT